jgi:hypothetical protein
VAGKHGSNENEYCNVIADSQSRSYKDKKQRQYAADYHPEEVFIEFHSLKVYNVLNSFFVTFLF